MRNNTTGNFNAAIGYQALHDNTNGVRNTAIGSDALFSNTTGDFNTAIGARALENNTLGTQNTGSGSKALFSNTTGNQNMASGYEALLFNTSGDRNSAHGVQSLYSSTTGSLNTAIGFQALYHNTTGGSNNASGVQALFSNTTGSQNMASGSYALYNATTALGNTAAGNSTLFHITTGNRNTALGVEAGASFNPSTSTFIGTGSDAAANVSNSVALGFEAIVTASNQVRIGNTSITSIGGQVGWTAFSDGRYKKNVKEDVPGLTFINKLRPVTYTLDVSGIDSKRKTNPPQLQSEAAKLIDAVSSPAEEQNAKQEKAKVVYTGFVAQEVEEAAKKLNYDFSGVDAPKNKEDFYGLRYCEFVVPLVKAVQELSAENKELKNELNELKEIVSRLSKREGVNSNGLDNTNANLSGAYLEQNNPNPFNGNTVIRYYLPENSGSAKVTITNMKGQLLKSISLNGKGKGQITLNANTLAAGSYTYSLWVDGTQADSKQMLLK